MAQRDTFTDSTKTKLISLLPRLRRFAAILSGNRGARDDLLRRACETMLAGEHEYQRGTPFDRWAFTRLYDVWLEGLREHSEPFAQGKGGDNLYQSIAGQDDASGNLADTAEILASLPPQQRCVLLLIYGEGFSYEEAAEILDTADRTIIERTTRALAAVIERSGLLDISSSAGAAVASLFPQQQAG